MAKVMIALGGNLSHEGLASSEIFDEVIINLSKNEFSEIAVSRYFRTPSFPANSGPDYANAVWMAETDLDPNDVMKKLHELEENFDRERGERWGARTLDLDLLFYDGMVLPSSEQVGRWMGLSVESQISETPTELLLPHPRIQDRGFVLVPMADIAPNWCHPILGLTTMEMLENLPEENCAEIRPILR